MRTHLAMETIEYSGTVTVAFNINIASAKSSKSKMIVTPLDCIQQALPSYKYAFAVRTSCALIALIVARAISFCSLAGDFITPLK